MAGNSVTSRLITDLMRDFGLTREQAAGFAGNLAHESANFSKFNEVGGNGVGMGQWTGPRRRDFENYAKRNDMSPRSYEANYGFLKHELTETPERAVLSRLKQANDVQSATRIVSDSYLRPGIPHMDRRVSQANNALQAIDLAAPNDAVSQALGYAPQAPTVPRGPSPATQSEDMRLMRTPSMSPTARSSATDRMIFNSTTPPPADPALQNALNRRAALVAPTPDVQSMDMRQMRDPAVSPSARAASITRTTNIPASQIERSPSAGLVDMGVGLPQNMAGIRTVDDMYRGTPAARKASDPALQSALDRLAASKAAPKAPYNPVTPAQKAAINAVPLSPAYNGVSEAQKLALSAVPAPSPYAPSNPLVAAANSAKASASQRLTATPSPDLALSWVDPQLGKVAPGAPTPVPTIPRQQPAAVATQLAVTSPILASRQPVAAVPDTNGLFGIPMTPNIPAQRAPVVAAAPVNAVPLALAPQPVAVPQASNGNAVSQALTGTPVRTASGSNAVVGQTFNPGNGYTYRVNSDGSTTNTKTGKTYGR